MTQDPLDAGELNYFLTKTIMQYVGDPTDPGMNYELLNEVVGVMECVKEEFYRRVVVPYEEQKRKENGDVYDDRTKT